MKDKDNDPVVVKANELIQKYKYTLSKTELRIVNTIISNIDSPLYDEELHTMSFDVNEFCKMLGWEDAGGTNRKKLKMILKGLSDKSSDYIDFGDYETIVRWIDRPIFHKNSSVVDLRLDDFLKPFLLQARGTIKDAKLRYYFEMDSKYSMRLYELLKSYDGFKHKEFEIDMLRIDIDALQKSYSNFAMFKRAVLEPAIEEINAVTDLEVSYKTKTRGRKVTHVVFSIKKKKLKIDQKNVIEGEGTEVPDEPVKKQRRQIVRKHLKTQVEPAVPEQELASVEPAAEFDEKEENYIFWETLGKEFRKAEIEELVGAARDVLGISMFERPLSDDNIVRVSDYLVYYYKTLKFTEIKTTRFFALRNKVMNDYDNKSW